MTDYMIVRFARAFFRRISRGDFKNAAYLTWYYSYLFFFDLRHGTNFTNSHPASDSEGTANGTGNFPAHPNLIRMYIHSAKIPLDAPILDVGHGSGIVLFVASSMGYVNLIGIEHARLPYEISVKNLGDRAKVLHGDAFSLDLHNYSAIFFFSPFRGEMAERFFKNLPDTLTHVITVNHDKVVEPHLVAQGFIESLRYQHPMYPNFNGVVWKR